MPRTARHRLMVVEGGRDPLALNYFAFRKGSVLPVQGLPKRLHGDRRDTPDGARQPANLD